MARVLSAPIIGHLTLPNLPNLKCPVSGVHSSITNKSKRKALREKAGADNKPIGQVEYRISSELWRCLNGILPSFSLFTADWRLSEEETGFQNEFKGMIEDATKGKPERQTLEGFIEQCIDQEVVIIHFLITTHAPVFAGATESSVKQPYSESEMQLILAQPGTQRELALYAWAIWATQGEEFKPRPPQQ